MRQLAAALLLALAVVAFSQPPQPLVAVTMYEGGLARVDYFVPTSGNLSLAIPLLGSPDEQLGVIVVDEWGDALAYGVNTTLNTLFVTCLDCRLVKASYYTQTLTSKVGATWILNLTAPYRIRIALPPNATVSGMSRLPETVYSIADRLVMEFEAGPLTLRYVILYAAPPSGGQPPAEEQKPSEKVQQPTSEPRWLQLLKTPLLYAVVAAVAAFAAAAIVLALKMKRGPVELVELSDEDVAILNALRSVGGGVFQSELQKMLSMPPTTLWRRVKRLEQLGYVRVEKRAGRNYIKIA